MFNYFEEKQSFSQWWVYIVPLLMLCITIFVTTQQLLMGQPVGNHPIADSNIWILWVFSLALLWFLGSFQLITRINKKGIIIRVRPLLKREYLWDDIEDIYVREYKPLREFGGYGIRFSKNGIAYNIKGNMGLQLLLKNGKRVLIGTQKAKELELIVGKIKEDPLRLKDR